MEFTLFTSSEVQSMVPLAVDSVVGRSLELPRLAQQERYAHRNDNFLFPSPLHLAASMISSASKTAHFTSSREWNQAGHVLL